MASKNYSKSHMNSRIYYRRLENGSLIYLLLYVDNLLIASKNMFDIDVLKRRLNVELEMKDLGAANKILGMEILRDRAAGVLRYLRRNILRRS